MTPEGWQEVKFLFDGIVERDPEERDAFLSMACGNDEELRREVIALLKSDSTVGDSLFERPLLNTVPEDSLAGRSLGPYRLLRRIGHGGMGSGYLAVPEDDQFHRRGALKTPQRPPCRKTANTRVPKTRHSKPPPLNPPHPKPLQYVAPA